MPLRRDAHFGGRERAALGRENKGDKDSRAKKVADRAVPAQRESNAREAAKEEGRTRTPRQARSRNRSLRI